ASAAASPSAASACASRPTPAAPSRDSGSTSGCPPRPSATISACDASPCTRRSSGGRYGAAVPRLEIKRQMGQVDIAAVSELLAVATDVDGHAPLGEHQWLDLVQGGRAGFAGLVAWEPGHAHPVGYAQVSRGAG